MFHRTVGRHALMPRCRQAAYAARVDEDIDPYRVQPNSYRTRRGGYQPPAGRSEIDPYKKTRCIFCISFQAVEKIQRKLGFFRISLI